MGSLKKVLHKFRLTLEMIAFSHSIFALPFALASFVLAYRLNTSLGVGAHCMRPYCWAHVSAPLLGKIIIAMVTARNTAMAWNRFIDRKIDAQNPRTATRHLPQGLLSPTFTLLFIILNALVFMTMAMWINRLCGILSPVALLIICAYSMTKRFTSLSHFILGVSLAIAPVGAWIAVTGAFSLCPILIGSGVLFWVAGFDILYSLQDEAFDRSHGLFSVPARIGTRPALWMSRLCHLIAVGFWISLYWIYPLGPIYLLTVIIIGGFLAWEQSLLSPSNLSRLNRAFFTLNGFVSLIFFIGVLFS